MLLAKLKEYDERMEDQLPPLYAMTPVAWIVVLDPDGRPIGQISRFDPRTARGKRGRDMAAPEVVRAAGIKPLLLADNGEYTFGRARDPEKQKRVDKAHAAYRDMLDRCAVATAEPSVLAVQRFYERGVANLLDEMDEKWDYGHKVTFEVLREDGTRCRPIDLPAVQEFWLSANAPASDTVDQCLVCGEHKPALDRLRAKIKGVRGGQSSGTSIISANSDAFESYGLKLSRVAPTCLECGEGFTRAANALIAGDNTSLSVGGTTFIFWTRRRVRFDFGALTRDPDPAQVKALLDSVRKGRNASIENDTEFYAAALSASGGRAVVRDWIDTTVGSVKERLGEWFDHQRIADPRDEDPTGLDSPRPLSLFRLAVSTVRKAEDIPVTTNRALFRAALDGTPLPMEIAFQAVRRNRAEQGVRRERAALIKLVLLSQKQQLVKEKNYMVALDKEHPEPAYHCGRLLAVVEQIQRLAQPGVNATVVDRFYGAASSTPAVVFGALLRDTQPRLAKLKKNPAQHGGLQNRLMEVCGQIEAFPKTLSLMQQALFSLGYYHQRAHDRAMAKAAVSARRKQSD